MSKKQNVSEYFDNIMGGSEAPKVSNEPEAAAESIISRYEEKHGALNVDYEPDKIENLF